MSTQETKRRIAVAAGETWGCTPFALAPPFGLGFCFAREGQIASFCEVKVRRYNHDDEPTVAISALHRIAAQRLYRATERPTVLLVHWTDRVGWILLHTTDPVAVTPGDGDVLMHYEVDTFTFMTEPKDGSD